MLAGAPPQLQEVGPFVLQRTTQRYNIAWGAQQSRVDWQSLPFEELLPDQSCATCTADAVVRARAPRAAPGCIARCNTLTATRRRFTAQTCCTRGL